MKKNICITVIFLMALLFCSALPVSASTIDHDANSFLNDLSFLRVADVQETSVDGTTQFQLSRTRQISTAAAGTSYAQDIVVLVAYDTQSAQNIENGIFVAKSARAGGSHYEYDWFAGSTMKLELTLYYTSKTINMVPYTRMDKVVAGCTVTNGSTLTELSLGLHVNGTKETGGGIRRDDYINILGSSNPYTTTQTASWGYIDVGTIGTLGATLDGTVVRPGGAVYSGRLSSYL